jgi:8-oxo-dGTP pyrophosphatase MutT (NUDIX family)
MIKKDTSITKTLAISNTIIKSIDICTSHAIIHVDDKFLFVRSIKGSNSGKLTLPGGQQIDSDKSLETTLIRELYEEIDLHLYVYIINDYYGVRFKSEKELSIKRHIFFINGDRLLKPQLENIKIKSFDEIDKIEWLQLWELKSLYYHNKLTNRLMYFYANDEGHEEAKMLIRLCESQLNKKEG